MFNDDDEDFDLDGYRKLPIFKKGQEIVKLVQQIVDLIPEDNEELNYFKRFILEDAYMLTAKIVNAEGGDLYDIRMENAAIIRKSAHSLMIQYHSLVQFGFEHAEYYMMVRQLIEEYRLLFIDWVATFDKTNYIIDRWGLFNPPGVGPFDVDIDDQISGDNSDFFDYFNNDDDDDE